MPDYHSVAMMGDSLIATLPPSERGACPHCGTELDGGGIWLHFYHEFTEGRGYWLDAEGKFLEGDKTRLLSQEEAAQVADKVAANYGASRTKGRWGTAIALVQNDRVQSHACGKCGAIWDDAGLTGKFLDRETHKIG